MHQRRLIAGIESAYLGSRLCGSRLGRWCCLGRNLRSTTEACQWLRGRIAIADIVCKRNALSSLSAYVGWRHIEGARTDLLRRGRLLLGLLIGVIGIIVGGRLDLKRDGVAWQYSANPVSADAAAVCTKPTWALPSSWSQASPPSECPSWP